MTNRDDGQAQAPPPDAWPIPPELAAGARVLRLVPREPVGEMLAMIEFLVARIPEDPDAFGSCEIGDDDTGNQKMRKLVAAYASHPDYREEWRP